MIIEVESLNYMFEGHNTEKHCSYECICHRCGCDVEIDITKTSGGYGLLGGVLYKLTPRDFLALCSDCFEKIR